MGLALLLVFVIAAIAIPLCRPPNVVSNLAAAGGFYLDKTWAGRVPGLSAVAGM